ncbi:MAG TPA: NADH:flavin oxidoreductase [Syntrophorhabdaceae bacterium]|nr:NADH:flavin oxidoreductase [Syntrophorhabdaceae bacterium]
MNQLFERTEINGMKLENRFVRSATVDNGAESGFVSNKQIQYFSELAAGGVGLIVTGMTCVHAADQIRPVQNSIADDKYIPAYKKLTASVHSRGAKIALQLVHSGRQRGKWLGQADGYALAPSVIEHDPFFTGATYRAATEEELLEIIVAFGNAARRAREAGFDAVQIHGAHAFLLSQFLSPHANRRDDAWGGSLENRLRLHREIYKTVRGRVGNDYPVLIKLGVQDGFPYGLDFSEGKKAALALAELGFDALEISQGLRGEIFEGTEYRTDIDRPDREAYFRRWCVEVKTQVAVPVMMVGGLRNPVFMKEIIEKGEADYISLCRPFIREPHIINDWQQGDLHRARCISCNRCIEALNIGDFLHCPQITYNKG